MAAAVGLALLLVALPGLQEPSFDDLPVFLWRQDAAGAPSPELLEALGGVRLHAKAEAAWLEERPELTPRTYRGQLAGRLVLHPERDRADQPFALDRRLEGLTDDGFRRAWEAELSATIRSLRGRFGAGLALGDEPGLTPFGDPLDQAFGEGPGPRTLTTGEALGARIPPAAWIEVRARERTAFTETLGWMAARTRAAAPEVPVGLLGLGDENAFRGLDLLAVARAFDFVETYPGGWATASVRTEREGHGTPELWRTVFATAADPADLRHQVHAHHLAGADSLVLWSDRALVDRPDRVEALAEAIARVRGLRADHPAFPPPPGKVALLRDFPSICACFHALARNEGGDWRRLLGGWQREHGARERAEEGIRLLLEDLGVDPAVHALRPSAPAAASRFPVWLAVHHRCLSTAQRSSLRAHLEAGGWLWTLGPCFEIDERGEPLAGAVAELRAAGAERYVRLDDLRAFDYPRLRRLAESPTAVRSRRVLARALRAAGIAPPPFEVIAPRGAAPYLRRWIVTEAGEPFCIAHEHRIVSGEESRPALVGGTVRIEPQAPATIRWHSGRAGRTPVERTLEPGEPAIFTLVPAR